MSKRGVSYTYGDLFEDWEIGIAKNLIAEFRRNWASLKKEEFEDLLQECLSHWLSARSRYDSHREASIKTFMGRIVRNKLQDILREKQAEKRRIDRLAVSLDDRLGDDDDSDSRAGVVADESADPTAQVELRLDLAGAIEKLNLRQRDVCRLLSEGLSVTEISRALKTPRSTISDEKDRIRKLFEQEGLRVYLD